MYLKQDKHKQAEACPNKALHLRERKLGKAHIGISYSYHNLAELYEAQHDYKQAIVLLY